MDIEKNYFYDAQRRIGDALRKVRMQTYLDLQEHHIAMHPARWYQIIKDSPIASVEDDPFNVPLRLFGFEVRLSNHIDVDALLLRHEVVA